MAGVFVVYIPTVEHEEKTRHKDTSQVNNVGEINHSLHVPRNGHGAQNGQVEQKPVELKPTKVILEEVLELHKITNVVWQKTSDGQFYQVTFQVDSQSRIEKILDVLDINVIENSAEATVSVVPCSIYYEGGGEEDEDQDETNQESKEDPALRSQKSEFLKSIKARLTVAQVVDGVRAGADLNFDYLLYIALAGMIAGFGLMDNSIVSIVASMLVSPLMGPIMALTFGLMIRDKSLSRMGIVSEAYGLLVTIIVGFILGLIFGPWQEAWERGPWPTSEMRARGEFRTLWVGALVATPSGAGVALALLWANVGSLVGVAISASLLPPCVNAGILWANSAIIAMKGVGEEKSSISYIDKDTGNLTEIYMKPSYHSPPGYEYYHSYNHVFECLALGGVSFLLAVINILFIILAGVLVLKIKEVAPMENQPLSRFWNQDIKIARDYNRTIQGGDSATVGQALMQEWAQLNSIDPGTAQPTVQNQMKIRDFATKMQEVEDDAVYQTVAKSMGQPAARPGRRMSRTTWSGNPLETVVDDATPRVWDISFQQQGDGKGRRRSVFVDLPKINEGKLNAGFVPDSSTVPQGNSRFDVSQAPDDGSTQVTQSGIFGGRRLSRISNRSNLSGRKIEDIPDV